MEVAQQDNPGTASSAVRRLTELRDQLSVVLRGKQDVIDRVILALLAEGSVLIEDVPGVGKTTLAKALAALIDVEYRRIQCTPDLLPSDVLGFSTFNPSDGSFSFREGPVFSNILLLDEINRASPRTQSALLEAMAERQVTVENRQYSLAAPFMVFATQNPLGFQGTFPLPEAQLDRFCVCLSMDYPDRDSEIDLLYDDFDAAAIDALPSVLSRDDLLSIQGQVRDVSVDRSLAAYIVSIIRETRVHPDVRLGCSPRATRMLFRCAQAQAFISERDFVLPDDIQLVAPLVLEHRLTMNTQRESAAGRVIHDILSRTEVPL